jgi:hypothetical protein
LRNANSLRRSPIALSEEREKLTPGDVALKSSSIISEIMTENQWEMRWSRRSGIFSRLIHASLAQTTHGNRTRAIGCKKATKRMIGVFAPGLKAPPETYCFEALSRELIKETPNSRQFLPHWEREYKPVFMHDRIQPRSPHLASDASRASKW